MQEPSDKLRIGQIMGYSEINLAEVAIEVADDPSTYSSEDCRQILIECTRRFLQMVLVTRDIGSVEGMILSRRALSPYLMCVDQDSVEAIDPF